MHKPKIRMRNRRGVYQSVDLQGGNDQSKNPLYSTTQNFYAANRKTDQGTTLTKAENRLRIIEQISKFREDKIKQEFTKLENELKEEEERNKKIAEARLRKQNYHEKQKEQLEQYQKQKMEKLRKKQMEEQQQLERRIEMEERKKA